MPLNTPENPTGRDETARFDPAAYANAAPEDGAYFPEEELGEAPGQPYEAPGGEGYFDPEQGYDPAGEGYAPEYAGQAEWPEDMTGAYAYAPNIGSGAWLPVILHPGRAPRYLGYGALLMGMRLLTGQVFYAFPGLLCWGLAAACRCVGRKEEIL